MMSVGLHSRMIGHPARIAGLDRFLDHIASHKDVWVCERVEIARHWHKNYPAAATTRGSAVR
jgi:allantoinase